MSFNSYAFIFIFLPVTVALCSAISSPDQRSARMALLISASLIFYMRSDPIFLPILLTSILLNYLGGQLLIGTQGSARQLMFVLFVSMNVGALAYFKNQVAILAYLSALTGIDTSVANVGFALAISFFTFVQLSYLIEIYRNPRASIDVNLSEYLLFVSFFPYLIVGPIVRHLELIPQFRDKDAFRITQENLTVGLSIFGMGLFKKVIFADCFALYANPVFDHATTGEIPGKRWSRSPGQNGGLAVIISRNGNHP